MPNPNQPRPRPGTKNKAEVIEDTLLAHWGPEQRAGMWTCGGDRCRRPYLPVPAPGRDSEAIRLRAAAADEAITQHALHQAAELIKQGVTVDEDPRAKLRRRQEGLKP